MTRTAWSRRALLRAAGATVALPLLPSLLPRGARAEDEPPVRLVFLYAPNGFRMDLWRPASLGSELVLGPTMAQLSDIAEHLLVVSGLENASGRGDRPGDHARGTATFLTCTPIDFEGVRNGVSADQVAASAIGTGTAFPSLELGVEGAPAIGLCDSGYSCAYTQHVAWAGPTTPLPKITNPRVVYDRLFAGSDPGATDAERARRKAHRASVLDLIASQATSLQRRVAVDDRHRLDEYLTGVRELERRLDGLDACGADREVPDEVLFEEHADVMIDLTVSALRCDLTRVATLMLGNAASNLVYRFLPGVNGAHHELSHHQRMARNLQQLAVIDAWEVERFGRMVRRLATAADGDGSLLDHTLVLFSSEISDGDRHNHDDLPVVLAGRGSGAVEPGRHLVASGAPMAELLLGMLHAAGAPVTGFADATRPLPGLLA